MGMMAPRRTQTASNATTPVRWARLGLCCLAFATVAVLTWRVRGPAPAGAPTYTSHAVVWFPRGEATDPMATDREPPQIDDDDLAAVLKQLDTFGDARTAATPAADCLVPLRERLTVTTSETSQDHGREVALTYADTDRGRAVAVVNLLAERLASRYRTTGPGPAAGSSTANWNGAHQDLARARGQFDAFLEEHFRRQNIAAEEAAGDLATSIPPAPATGTAPAARPRAVPVNPVENPEWTELNELLLRLRHHRSSLLVVRTAAHPEVREIEGRIDAAVRRLDALPRYLGNAPEVAPTAISAGPVPAAPPAFERAARLLDALTRQQLSDAQAYRQHKAQIDRATQASNRTLAAERASWQAAPHQAPRVRLAEQAAVEQGGPARGAKPIWLVALSAGLVACGAVAMISSGAAIDVPLGSPSQAAAALSLPVLGTVPSLEAIDHGRLSTRGAHRARWACIFGGITVLAIMLAVVLA